MSSSAVDNDQGAESDEGSSVDPSSLSSNPSSVTTSHADFESDLFSASLSGFETNDLSHSQPSSGFGEPDFETPTSPTLKENQQKTDVSQAQVDLNITSPETQLFHQSTDVIQHSTWSSEITINERLDTFPPSGGTDLATFGNLPNLLTQQASRVLSTASAKSQLLQAEETEAEMFASADFSRKERTGNKSADVSELEQFQSNSTGDVGELVKMDAALLKIREPTGTPLEEVDELEENSGHNEDESGGTEKSNARPSTKEITETIEYHSITLPDNIQSVSDRTSRIITELGETDNTLQYTSSRADQLEDIGAVERVEDLLSEIAARNRQLAAKGVSYKVKYLENSIDSDDTSVGRSDETGLFRRTFPQDSTDGYQDVSLRKDAPRLSSASFLSPFAPDDDLDGADNTGAPAVKEPVQVRMYLFVCVYLFMYVCMYRIYVCMYGCMDVCMYACMYVCMYKCMYV